MSNLDRTLFVFTTTPAGLGHIRVMDAIKEGRPGHITSVDVGINDIKANRIHDLGSRVKFFVKLTEFYQTNPIAEAFVTFIYTMWLRRHTKAVIDKFTEISGQYPNFRQWVVISTHFALAHSISSAKEILEKKLKIKIYLCVIVTDDSPQKVWAVKGADLIFTPSPKTQAKLMQFFPKESQAIIKAISYPFSPRLSQNMTPRDFQFVVDQLDPKINHSTQIEIPISGAAVQLEFFKRFMQELCRVGYDFSVIGQESLLTKGFFNEIQRLPHVQLSIGKDPWETVHFYESLFYQPNRPSIEITKPSEQAFKAILNPRQRGGVILLLTAPIGRQEYDNLDFLRRNGLMPDILTERQLFVDEDLTKWKEMAKKWRAIRIHDDPVKAAEFVKKLKSAGIFYSMLSAVVPEKAELKDNGSTMIWEEIGRLIG